MEHLSREIAHKKTLTELLQVTRLDDKEQSWVGAAAYLNVKEIGGGKWRAEIWVYDYQVQWAEDKSKDAAISSCLRCLADLGDACERYLDSFIAATGVSL